jgi:hypothetical protein
LLYLAWLRRLLLDGKKLKHKDTRTQNEIMRKRRAEGRDIGPIPAVKDPARREACRLDLDKFLLIYLPRRFYLPFSPDHRKVIGKLQSMLLRGELYAEGVYRSFGKTAIAEGGALWAALYGHREFIPVLAATEGKAGEIMESIQNELRHNDLLAEDFPEVCFPIRALEGIAHRCVGQLCQGRPTEIEWRVDAVRFPTIAGSVSSGMTILASGITGSIRGMKYRAPDGTLKRPDLVIIDDAQNDKSAASPTQCDYRERLITGAVLGLAGPDKKISGLMTTTVICKGDIAHRFLDRRRHPEWQGDTIPLVKKWADRHDDLWLKQYAELRRRDIPDAEGGRKLAEQQATEFYLAHRAEMDAGCQVSWPEKREKGEVSAIQNAYNLLVDRGLPAFMAEQQCAPLDEFEGIEPALEPRDILAKFNGLPRYTAEHGASAVAAFVDCGSTSHVHWLTCWFGDGFTGGLLDRGVLPVTRGKYGVEAALTQALAAAAGQICGRAYPVAGGGELRLALCLVDSGWQARTVYQFCRQSPFAAVLAPSKGQGGELELRAPKLCARRDQGDGWYHALTLRRDARLLVYDTDKFKSFAAERLRTPMGGRGCFSLWGSAAEVHRAFAEQVTAERPESKTKKTGDVFQKWTMLPGRENHGWDCLVGCHVAAARVGVTLDAGGGQASGARLGGGRALKLSEIQNARRA